MADQWYQKWSVVFSIEHMCNWVPKGTHKMKMFEATAWLNRTADRYHIQSDHLELMQDACRYISDWHQSNRALALKGIFKLNTMPFYPPTWFINKSKQSKSECMAPSYLATFLPPYRLEHVPERWDQVFLKGLTVQPGQKSNLDPILINTTISILGLTVHFDEQSQSSRLMFVMPKAKFGNLESHIQNELPTDYLKPCQLALSITMDIKNLHWTFIHGNIHPRNILMNYADYVGELVDVSFMKRTNDTTLSLAGRWPYLASEIVSTGQSTEADIYALGIILWQLISRVTFPNDAPVHPHIYRIEPIPDVLKEWQDIYIDCLSKDPSKRPNAYDLHKRLTDLYSQLKQNPVPISGTTLDYIKSRRQESDRFLDNYHTTNPQKTFNSQSNDILYPSGDQVWTASVTRFSHPFFTSYPNILQFKHE
ncbi:hypothetical protein RO3G_14165 [Rhizopus delemar RA 99-880]|uniref:Protein kinase domain-containing protein n=3 Tax=Rhizopus TaxID=4842 RepID=I1CLX4_RHIO9|nr:hypothetical protein RO3G_14165 [Rhizopus delemar RA 99-880]|eukprot:EIE89454.1 hypothetical protein RO3G_14165 [Rhizopus delemar RA 99-880]